MGRDRAAYMREYRARNRAPKGLHGYDRKDEPIYPDERQDEGYVPYADRIAELEEEVRHLKAEEVRHLKAELAKRPSLVEQAAIHDSYAQRFNTRPFTPVPKRK